MQDCSDSIANAQELLQSCAKPSICDLNRRFIECIRDCYFFQNVVEPTRQREIDPHSTLELIFTNEEHMIDDVCIETMIMQS